MGRMGNLWAEFKAFAFKGNMLELAVAVVIGAAFGKVVTAMVDDIVMPAVSYAVTAAASAKEAAADAAKAAAEKTGIASTQPTTQEAVVTTGNPQVDAVAQQAADAKAKADKAAADAKAAKDKADADAKAAQAKPKDPTQAVQFDLMVGRFKIGDFIGALLNFVIVAFAVFIMIVKLLGSMMKKVAGSTPAPSAPTMKECPYCLSSIPIKARKCGFCTSDLAANS